MKGKPGRAYLLGTYLWEKNMFIDEKDYGIEETQDWLRENLHELFVLDGKTIWENDMGKRWLQHGEIASAEGR